MIRTGIFAFYDAQGIADEYVTVLLRGLRPFCVRILCIVNGKITKSAEDKLREVCDTIIKRSNEGLDINAYREGLFYVLSHPLDEDELLFLNGTVFGPVYPFSELFGEMDAKTDLDFWGMTQYTGHDEDIWELTGIGYIPPHIQSYFWAARKSLFQSSGFKKYWENLPIFRNYQEAVSLHEMLFTKRFAELGYRWDTYVQPNERSRYFAYMLMADPVRLLKEQRCPVVKRKSFFVDRTEQPMPVSGDAGRDLYAFLRDETDYDTALIVKNITRTENNFNYTMSMAEVISLPQTTEKITYFHKTAQIIWLTEPNCLCEFKNAAFSTASVYVYHTSEMNHKQIQEVFPSAAVVRETAADIRAVLKQARADTKGFSHIAWLHGVPTICDRNPGKPVKKELDFASFYHAMRLCEGAETVISRMDRDKTLGAVAPLPLTHRRHLTPAPNWKAVRERLMKVIGNQRVQLETETLCAGWNGFVADNECFLRFAEMAERFSSSDDDTMALGYLLPIAAQSLEKTVAFGGDSRVICSQALSEYTQLRKITKASSEYGLLREDQIAVAQTHVYSFFHNFFHPQTFKDRIYFALMALLSRKRFLRLVERKKKTIGLKYPYDFFTGNSAAIGEHSV